MLGIWLAVGCTIAIYSFLYKDNVVFKLAEHLYVGLSAGYGFCYAFFKIVWPDLLLPLGRVTVSSLGGTLSEPLSSHENWWLLIPLIFSILILTRFFRRIDWLSKWSFAFIIGTTAGITIPFVTSAYLIKQIVPSLRPLIIVENTLAQSIISSGNAILILIGIGAVLCYFFFSLEQKKTMKVISRIGIYYMMIAFGAAFGYTIMGRASLTIARFQHLVEWGSAKYAYASIVLFFGVTGLVVFTELLSRRGDDNKPSEIPKT